MDVLIIASLLAIFLTCLASSDRIKRGLEIAFIILAFIYAIRYNFGTDYWNYYAKFIEAQKYNSLKQCFWHSEFGWYILNYLFKSTTFDCFSAFIGILINIIVYRFIKINVPKKWWTFSVFIYVFNPSLYVLSFSMMRQSFAMALFLFSWEYIKDRKILYALTIIFLAVSVHSSSAILLPFVFWGYLPKNNVKILAFSYIGAFVLFMTNIALMRDIIENFMLMDQFSEYAIEHGNREGSTNYGLGFLVMSIPFFMTIWLLLKKRFKTYEILLVLLASLGTVLLPFGQVINLVIRLSLYFTIFTIASIPIVYSKVQKKYIKYLLILSYIVVLSYSYLEFFDSGSVYYTMYNEYHTVFNK